MARTTRSTKSKKAGVIKVDFTGVEASGNVPEGRQLLTVDGTPEIKTSDNSGNDYINWVFKAKGGKVYHTTSLQPQALWNLRNVLEALGLEVTEAAMDLDLSEMDGLTCGGEIEHEVYQGKKKPRLIDLFPEEELDEAEEAEEESDDEPEAAGDELTYDDVMDMDKDDLLELAEENDIKVPVKTKRNLDALRTLIAAELELEAEEQEEEEEEPEEEEEAPVAKTRRKKGAAKELGKGSKVTFVDDGDDIEGTVKSINTKEKFAVVDVDGDEWEVELSDLNVV